MDMLRQAIDRAFNYAWQPESALVIVMAALLGVILLRLLPASRQQILGTLILYAITVAGQIVAGAFSVMNFEMAAQFFHEAFILAGGLALIRLWGMLVFRILLPALRLSQPRILEDIVVMIACIAWGLVRLRVAGADFSGIVATSAVITAVIGFSMQDTLGNIVGGLAVQLDNSVRIGDWLKIDDLTGRVVDMRWRSTSIETRNGETVVVPNSVLMKGKFLVLGRRTGEALAWRRQVFFNVDLGTPPARVIPVIEAAINEAEIANVGKHPSPSCVLLDFEHGYGRYGLRYWLTDLMVDDPTDSTVRTHIYTALQRNGMRIAVGEHNVRLTRVDEQHQAAVQARELARRVNALRRVDLFRLFRDDEIRQVAESLVYTPFARGDVITRQGNVAHWLYILASGEADVSVETGSGSGSSGGAVDRNGSNGGGNGGGRRVVSQLRGGSYFGEMGLMTGAARTATVTARTDVECYRLDKMAFQDIIAARPEIAEEISRVMMARRGELDVAAMHTANAHDSEHLRSHLLERMRRFFGIGAD